MLRFGNLASLKRFWRTGLDCRLAFAVEALGLTSEEEYLGSLGCQEAVFPHIQHFTDVVVGLHLEVLDDFGVGGERWPG